MSFHVIIPARYHSSRLPGKLLMDLAGQTILSRAYRQALLADPASITIAADHPLIAEEAARIGAQVVMTSSDHPSGTDRVAEVVRQLQFSSDEIIVNVQGDEPLIDPKLIRQVADSLLSQSSASMATLCWPVESLVVAQNPNVVKVVRDHASHALYFSRSIIPMHRDHPETHDHLFRHIGLYAYRTAFLLKMVELPPCTLEKTESLEQLRVLYAGYKIKVDTACVQPLQDINTAEDLSLARAFLREVTGRV